MRLRAIPLAAAALACLAGAVQARVMPPPLPPGSDRVRVEAGMHLEERKRHVRAHHHKLHHRKDVTRDDSIHGAPPAPATPIRTAAGAGARMIPPLAPRALPLSRRSTLT